MSTQILLYNILSHLVYQMVNVIWQLETSKLSLTMCSSFSRDLALIKPFGYWPQATVTASDREYLPP